LLRKSPTLFVLAGKLNIQFGIPRGPVYLGEEIGDHIDTMAAQLWNSNKSMP
jgi:hypothetical protein